MSESSFRVSAADVYAIPVGGQWILHSPRSMTSALVNRAAVKAVAACASGDASAASGTMADLWRRLSEVDEPPERPPLRPAKLVIIPTRSCNMRCVYCDFDASVTRSATLDPRLACRLIDDAAAKLRPASPGLLRIHFFGGEPLLARQCVETVVHYARMVCARTGLVPWFEVTTNGLFDPSAIPLLGDYMDSVVISLDGDESTHDVNRRRHDGRGTYAAIAANIQRLSEFPVELSLRACVTSRSADSMARIASRFCSEFEFAILCFEMLAPNRSGVDAGLRPPDPYSFAAGVLKAERLATAHDVRVVHGPSELAARRGSSCPVGLGTLMLSPDGRLTACYLEVERWTRRGLDPVIGRVDRVSGPMIYQEKLDRVAELLSSKPRCERCFCRYSCAGGCHIEQTPPGCSIEYDDRCRATRIITAGRLLGKLRGPAATERFVDEPISMQAVVENPDDRLTAWNVGAARGES